MHHWLLQCLPSICYSLLRRGLNTKLDICQIWLKHNHIWLDAGSMDQFDTCYSFTAVYLNLKRRSDVIASFWLLPPDWISLDNSSYVSESLLPFADILKCEIGDPGNEYIWCASRENWNELLSFPLRFLRESVISFARIDIQSYWKVFQNQVRLWKMKQYTYTHTNTIEKKEMK